MKLQKMQKKRLINAICYINSNVADLSIMKLDKMLYFFDLESFKVSGLVPTGLFYHTEKNGPAPKSLNSAIIDNKSDFFLNEIIFDVESSSDYTKPLKIKTCTSFDQDFFKPFQLDILKNVVQKYSQKSAEELSDLTHEIGSPYDLTYKRDQKLGTVIDFCLALNEESEVSEEYVKKELGYCVGQALK